MREGDYYGSTVNTAHRIVNIANPGTVIISDEFHAALMEEAGDEFTSQPLRPRLLQDLGSVQLWWLGRAGQAGPDVSGSGAEADRRRNARWERVAEILSDLQGIRDIGERVVAGARRPPSRPSDDEGGEAVGP
jgi:hypothetical protein